MYLDRRSALLRAAADGNVNQVREALANGEDPHRRDSSSRDAFDYLMINRSVEGHLSNCAKRLAEAERGDHISTKRLHCLKLLLSHGADVGKVDRHGWTVLHRASWLGDRPVVELLLRHGASPSLPDEQGRIASDLAAVKGFKDIANCLDAAGTSLYSLCRQVVRKALGRKVEACIHKLPIPKAVKLFLNFGAPYPGWSARFVPSRPWTDSELRMKKPSSKDLAAFMAQYASEDFLQRQNLNASEEKADDSAAQYSDLAAQFQQLYLEEDFRPFDYKEQIWTFRKRKVVAMSDESFATEDIDCF